VTRLRINFLTSVLDNHALSYLRFKDEFVEMLAMDHEAAAQKNDQSGDKKDHTQSSVDAAHQRGIEGHVEALPGRSIAGGCTA
jgi:hypothetical protein